MVGGSVSEVRAHLDHQQVQLLEVKRGTAKTHPIVIMQIENNS